ncbi:hypothetical protein LX90_003396 [Lentzea flava]|nr:hypothetical protein [Lentzea flava]
MFLQMTGVVDVGVRMRLAAVRVGVLVFDVLVRVCPVRMRVGDVAVAVLVTVHFIAHVPDAGTGRGSPQLLPLPGRQTFSTASTMTLLR